MTLIICKQKILVTIMTLLIPALLLINERSSFAQGAAEPSATDESQLNELTSTKYGVTGAVYTMTNEVSENKILVFNRFNDGSLKSAGSYSTGGTGSGGGLGNQGGVILSQNKRWLFAVNAGSNQISVFRIKRGRLQLKHVVYSGGTKPVSLTFHHRLLYVLNAGSDNIVGFRLAHNGHLCPLPESSRPLSGVGTAPAQIEFSPDGDTLVVTEKATNLISVFPVDELGFAGSPNIQMSSGATPFGFAFGKQNQLLVSEAFGGMEFASALSSYQLDDTTGGLDVISGSIRTNQTAACWTVVTPDSRFAFVSNTASNSISSYSLGVDGSLSLINSQAANTDAGPIDMILSNNGRFLYVLNSDGRSIRGYHIEYDGSLTAVPGPITDLPLSTNGLAAR